MTLLERAFFGLFVLWSKCKGYEEFTGINALTTIFLTSWLNFGTIILSILYFDLFEIEMSDFFAKRLNWIMLIVIWALFLGLLFLRKNQLSKYRAKILELEEEEGKRVRAQALIYVIGSIVIAFLMAILVVNRIPESP